MFIVSITAEADYYYYYWWWWWWWLIIAPSSTTTTTSPALSAAIETATTVATSAIDVGKVESACVDSAEKEMIVFSTGSTAENTKKQQQKKRPGRPRKVFPQQDVLSGGAAHNNDSSLLSAGCIVSDRSEMAVGIRSIPSISENSKPINNLEMLSAVATGILGCNSSSISV